MVCGPDSYWDRLCKLWFDELTTAELTTAEGGSSLWFDKLTTAVITTAVM